MTQFGIEEVVGIKSSLEFFTPSVVHFALVKRGKASRKCEHLKLICVDTRGYMSYTVHGHGLFEVTLRYSIDVWEGN